MAAPVSKRARPPSTAGELNPMQPHRMLQDSIPADVHREISIGWTASDFGELKLAFKPYIGWIQRYLSSGADLPSHIPNSGSIAIPIGSSTTPENLFAALGQGVRYSSSEYPQFWVTVHYPNPEPVVTLVPKKLPGTPAKLVELCDRCSKALKRKVGGPDGMFLAWLQPGFSWAMHTDHDNLYEQTEARVHVPLITSPPSLYIWGCKDESGREEWVLTKHLEANRAHYVRVDVPHTVLNGDATRPRLHLILDVH